MLQKLISYSVIARSLLRTPIFAAAFILLIVIGIGPVVSVFAVANALLFRPLPVSNAEQLVELTGIYRSHSLTPLSYPMYVELERSQRVFSQLCGWTLGSDFYLSIDGGGSLTDIRSVTGNYYAVLGTKPALGRLLETRDMDNSQVAVIDYQFWQTRFGGSPSVIGRSLQINDHLFTIVGVTPRWFSGFTRGISPPITVPFGAAGTYDRQNRALLGLFVIGRLRPRTTISQAQAQVQSFWPGLLTATAPANSTGTRRLAFLAMGVHLDSAAHGANTDGDLRAKSQHPLLLLLSVVALILLIICFNLASLVLTRANQRQQEISTRVALGATLWQATRFIVAETVVLSFCGAILALPIARLSSTFSVRSLTHGQTVPILLDIRPDWRVFTFTATAALLTGLLTGLLPAWHFARRLPAVGSRRDHNGVGVSRKWNIRKGMPLIIVQISLALVVLEAAGLLLTSLERVYDPLTPDLIAAFWKLTSVRVHTALTA